MIALNGANCQDDIDLVVLKDEKDLSATQTILTQKNAVIAKDAIEKSGEVNCKAQKESLLLDMVQDSYGKKFITIRSSDRIFLRTPLHRASFEGHHDMVKSLLNEGVDINATDISGMTPLLVACSNKQFEVATVLINRNADVNCKSKDDWFPLMYALLYENFELLELLIAKGADKTHLFDKFCGKSETDRKDLENRVGKIQQLNLPNSPIRNQDDSKKSDVVTVTPSGGAFLLSGEGNITNISISNGSDPHSNSSAFTSANVCTKRNISDIIDDDTWRQEKNQKLLVPQTAINVILILE